MASHVQKLSQKSVEEMMKDLKVDPRAKDNNSGAVASKERSQSDTTSWISLTGDVRHNAVEGDRDHESLETYQGLPCPFGGYYGCYYPGFDGLVGELNDQRYYGDGMELQYPVMQGENGSLVYFMPGIQPYDASNSYLPVNPIGFDGQYACQQLHSPTPVFPSLGYFGYGEYMSSPYFWDPSLFLGDGVYGDGYCNVAELPGSKPNLSSSGHILANSKNKTSFSSLNALLGHGLGNQLKSSSKGKGYLPFTTFPLYNQGKGRTVYPNSFVGKKSVDQELFATENVKGRSKVNNGVRDLANGKVPLNKGNGAGYLAVSGNGKSYSISSFIVRRDQYNLSEFVTKYDQAFFFVIKSYSEDDVHKSIKYNVWSSTPNGNKKLDNAYQDAEKRVAEKGGKCPVFLFFSVNASGQFCGVAEMIGPVDFEKNMDFWQQDKWTGYFPVKWHIIKDVPNPQLLHIILENNENKPVTNSRDTQEVRLSQGIEMLNIFKNYVSKTSILDDFDFYESREKVMLQKKIRSPMPHFDQIKKTDNLAIDFQPVDISAVKCMEPQDGNTTEE